MAGMMPRMATSEERFTFDTGKGEVSAAYAAAGAVAPVLVVAHGAGSGMDHPFLVGFTEGVNDLGIATMRFNFPYMEAGRRSPDAPAAAVAAWRAAMKSAASRAGAVPMAAGGKSYG